MNWLPLLLISFFQGFGTGSKKQWVFWIPTFIVWADLINDFAISGTAIIFEFASTELDLLFLLTLASIGIWAIAFGFGYFVGLRFASSVRRELERAAVSL